MGDLHKIFSKAQSSKLFIIGGVFFGLFVLVLVILPQAVLADDAGYALVFDGVMDYVSLGDTSELMGSSTWDSEKTFSLWINPTGESAPLTAPTSGALILGVDRPRLFGITRAVYHDQDQIYVWNVDENGIDVIGVPFTPGEWFQVTMVHSGGILSAYKNGTLVGSVPSGATNVPVGGSIDGNLFLGGSGRSNPSLYFAGQIDEVRFWDRALDVGVIQDWVTSEITPLHPHWENLAAYFKMGAGAGIRLADYSDNNHPGTLLGGMSDANWVSSGALTLPGQPTPSPTPTHTTTNTNIPPSDTPSPTNTATPADTATPTNTSVPPSDTPTATNTPIPPSDTPTATPLPPTATSTTTSVPPTPTSTPTSPPSSRPNLVEIGYADTPGYAYSLEVFNHVAYIADKNRSFQIFDVADPTNPNGLSSFETVGGAYGEAVSGNFVYIPDTLLGLRILDVSDPANPQETGSLATPGFTWEAAAKGDFVYLSERWDGLTIVNVADPANPFLVGNIVLADQVLEVEVANAENYAYAATYGAGLRVVDISDKGNPREVGSFDSPGLAYGLYLEGNTVYLADGGSGLWIIDVSDPQNPALLGGYNTVGWARSVVVSGNYAFIADWTGGITVLDVTDPADPILIQSFDTPGRTRDIFTTGDTVYIADYEGGLRIYAMFAPQ